MWIFVYGLFGYVLFFVLIFGEVLCIGFSYLVLFGIYFYLLLEVVDGCVWLVVIGYGEDEVLWLFNIEFCLGLLKVICVDLFGQLLFLLEVVFDYVGDEVMVWVYVEGFVCELYFECECSVIGFVVEWLECLLLLVDLVIYWEMLEQCWWQNIDLVVCCVWLDKVWVIFVECLQDLFGLEELVRCLNCLLCSLCWYFQQQCISYQ